MNILLITFDPPQNVGGIEGRVRNYSKFLKELGHEVSVISIYPGGDYSSTDSLGMTVLSLPSSTKSLFKALGYTRKEISRREIDSVFFLSGALTIYGLVLLSYARLKGIRTLVLYYGKDILSTKQSYISRFALWISPKLAGKIVTNSRYTQSLLPRKYKNKTEILYPSVDPGISYELRSPQKNGHAKVVLFVGRLVARKGVDDLIRAFHEVLEKVPDAFLEIVGDGPELDSLKTLTRDLGVTDKIRFYGSQTGSSLYDRYASCDVFVMPSKTMQIDAEGFGTVFLEASVFGKPSIGTLSGGIPEAVLDGKTGLLVPESDVLALSRAIETLLRDSELSTRLGANARTRVLDQFTWKNSTQFLVSILREN